MKKETHFQLWQQSFYPTWCRMAAALNKNSNPAAIPMIFAFVHPIVCFFSLTLEVTSPIDFLLFWGFIISSLCLRSSYWTFPSFRLFFSYTICTPTNSYTICYHTNSPSGFSFISQWRGFISLSLILLNTKEEDCGQ